MNYCVKRTFFTAVIIMALIMLSGCNNKEKQAKVQVQLAVDSAVTAADTKLSNGDIQGAYNIYSRVLNVATDNKILAHVYANRGLALMQASQLDAAKEDFNKACNMGNSEGCRYLAKM